MNISPNEFSSALRRAVRQKFGRVTSAADLARQLDLATRGQVLVSAEAVRKWLTGKSIPRASAVAALERLLGCPLVNDHLNFDFNEMQPDELLAISKKVNDRLSQLHANSKLLAEMKSDPEHK